MREDGGEHGSGIEAGVECRVARPRVLSRDELRALDASAVREMGVPSVLLMENAARGASEVCREMLGDVGAARVLVVAGTGNNGGDGLAMARHLGIHGVDAGVLLVGERSRLTPDAAVNMRALESSGAAVIGCETADEAEAGSRTAAAIAALGPVLLVDALLGTGLSRAVTGAVAGCIGACNAARLEGAARAVLSLDVPSGLDADSGMALGAAVQADTTVTFAALKRGFFALESQPFLGRVVLVDIGVPGMLVSRYGEAYEPGASVRRGRGEGSGEGVRPAAPASRGRAAGDR